MLEIPILFEDDCIVVINKPDRVVVNRAETVRGETLQDWMESRPWYASWAHGGVCKPEMTPELQALYTSRSGMVHRLDKDTSGVMVFAKDPLSLAELMRQFRERETEKTYLALAHGKFSTQSGIVRLPLGRSTGDRERFAVDPEGKMSETAYEVLEFFPHPPATVPQKKAKSYQGFTYLRLHPKTGRTHQIRVHMAHIKHPLVGDLKYVGRKRSRIDWEWCPRQFLHAERLVFTHPQTGKRMEYTAELAPDLKKVLIDLKNTENL